MEFRQTSRPDEPPSGSHADPPGRGFDGYDRFAEPGREAPPPRGVRIDLSPLLVLVDALRRAMPVELQAQFTALLREVLLTLRSLIDWYLERLDRGPREPPVEDIPID